MLRYDFITVLESINFKIYQIHVDKFCYSIITESTVFSTEFN